MSTGMGGAGADEALKLRTQVAELRKDLELERAARQTSERALIRAIDSEQHRVAQLLHDTLAQSLNAARLYARVTRDKIRTACPDLSPAFAELEQVVKNATDEFNELVPWLKPAQLQGSDLLASLTELSRAASRVAPCEFRYDEAALSAAPESQADLLRVAQMTLHALLRSCRAQSMQLDLTGDDREVQLQLRAACDRALPDELATLLSQRARVMGGSVEVHHEAGRHITLTYRLPKQR